jgi:hypothetical protein
MRRLGDDLARLTVLPISGTTFVDDSLPVTVMTLLPSLALVLVYDPMALLKMVASLEKAPLPASAGCCDDAARLASGCPGRTVAAAAVVDMLAESSQKSRLQRGCSERARARARASSLRGSVVRQQKLCGGGTTEENEQPRDVTPQSRDLLDTNAIANGKSLHCSIFHRGQKDACGEGIQEDETAALPCHGGATCNICKSGDDGSWFMPS